MRQERRDKARQALQGQSPAKPKGLLAVFQQKAYQQALATLEQARKVAARLVEEARRLTQRLLEASGLHRLVAWSHGVLKRDRPGLVALHEPATTLSRGSATEYTPQAERQPAARLPAPEPKASPPQLLPGVQPGNANPRQPDFSRSAGDDLKAQAAEGVAAFRARFAKTRNVEPARTPADHALEQLKALVEAQRAKEAASRKSKQNDRGLFKEIAPRDRSRDGPAR